ncbi:hypothetical protein G3I13_02065 [Streptomyces sp. SID6673]|nr:hypothetical protein [Streptomyces sp. SID11726]NDZ94949.1 hypothetical protein [Streptomyces sp. SID11726]NEB23107.1 hypothetical protein [Streptomyces sp. SID6673]
MPIVSAWLPAGTVSQGSSTAVADLANALAIDGSYATSSEGRNTVTLEFNVTWTSGGATLRLPPSAVEDYYESFPVKDVFGQTRTIEMLGNGETYLELESQSTSTTGRISLSWKHFDVSSIPAGSVATAYEARLKYGRVGGVYYIDGAEMRVTYNPPSQAFAPSTIVSCEAFESPSFSPGITYVNLDGAPSAEAVASAQLNLIVYPDSAPSAEAVGDPLMTLFAATLGGISSAESVSALGATTMTVAVDSLVNSQSFGDTQMNMALPVSSVTTGEAFGDLTTKLVFSLDGIPTAESVSHVSFTTQFINGAGDIPSEEGFGTLLHTMFMSAFGNIASEASVEAPTFTQSPPPPPPDTDWSALGKEDEKVYVYKVYDSAGTYIGVWSDVKDDPEWTQRINTPGTTTTVILARSPNTTKESRDVIVTQDGEPITSEDGEELISVYETPNSVGEGTDVELDYNVDIYVHYGQFEVLTTQDGEPITTEDGEELLVASGAPMGVRVFSGYVMDYESVYGEESGVTVTLASHGHELSNEIVRDGETTTVGYPNQPLETTLKQVLDTNPGTMTYDAASIQATGVSVPLKFQLNTKLEAADSIYTQTPDGWYWFGHVGENLIYLKPVSTGYDHTFILGKHIKSLRVRRSIESIKNVVYFVGGEVTEGDPSTTKFKKYVDSASVTNWRQGIERITDRRYTLDTSMANRANKVLSSYAQPIFTSPLVISAARYDIESIKLGQTVGFAGFGNFIDALPPLQIVSYSYAATQVTLELGQVQERQVDTLSKAEEQLNNEQFMALPTAPS